MKQSKSFGLMFQIDTRMNWLIRLILQLSKCWALFLLSFKVQTTQNERLKIYPNNRLKRNEITLLGWSSTQTVVLTKKPQKNMPNWQQQRSSHSKNCMFSILNSWTKSESTISHIRSQSAKRWKQSQYEEWRTDFFGLTKWSCLFRFKN